jgi:transcriptional regulator with XRE-family HTH domain
VAAEGADPFPELVTNDEWRMLAVSARKERKWTQEELAKRITAHTRMTAPQLTATQAAVSQLESGAISSSRLVRPISELLAIPEPMNFRDELDKEWWLAGHQLRDGDMEVFKLQLQLAKQMAKSILGRDIKPENDQPEDKKPTGK